jgi:hypothetical protein
VAWLIAGEMVRRTAGWGTGHTPNAWIDPVNGSQWSVGSCEEGVKVFETPHWAKVTEAGQSILIFRNQLAEALATLRSLENVPADRRNADYGKTLSLWKARKVAVTGEIVERELVLEGKVENEYLVTDAQLAGAWGPIA